MKNVPFCVFLFYFAECILIVAVDYIRTVCYNKTSNKKRWCVMNNVNKTLYIPLYGKAFVSNKGIILQDKKAEEIWKAEGFLLKGRAKSKWLAYYMGIRSAVFDEWVKDNLNNDRNAVVIHIGCGMDSRVMRVGITDSKWYDVDFFEVIEERKKYYNESENYQMIAGDVRDSKWLSDIAEKGHTIVVMEGVSMYLTVEELQGLIKNLCDHFEQVSLLMDCYSVFAAKMSKIKNPINSVGVTRVYGLDNPEILATSEFKFIRELTMIPKTYVDELSGFEKFIFKNLYA